MAGAGLDELLDPTGLIRWKAISGDDLYKTAGNGQPAQMRCKGNSSVPVQSDVLGPAAHLARVSCRDSAEARTKSTVSVASEPSRGRPGGRERNRPTAPEGKVRSVQVRTGQEAQHKAGAEPPK